MDSDGSNCSSGSDSPSDWNYIDPSETDESSLNGNGSGGLVKKDEEPGEEDAVTAAGAPLVALDVGGGGEESDAPSEYGVFRMGLEPIDGAHADIRKGYEDLKVDYFHVCAENKYLREMIEEIGKTHEADRGALERRIKDSEQQIHKSDEEHRKGREKLETHIEELCQALREKHDRVAILEQQLQKDAREHAKEKEELKKKSMQAFEAIATPPNQGVHGESLRAKDELDEAIRDSERTISLEKELQRVQEEHIRAAEALRQRIRALEQGGDQRDARTLGSSEDISERGSQPSASAEDDNAPDQAPIDAQSGMNESGIVALWRQRVSSWQQGLSSWQQGLSSWWQKLSDVDKVSVVGFVVLTVLSLLLPLTLTTSEVGKRAAEMHQPHGAVVFIVMFALLGISITIGRLLI